MALNWHWSLKTMKAVDIKLRQTVSSFLLARLVSCVKNEICQVVNILLIFFFFCYVTVLLLVWLLPPVRPSEDGKRWSSTGWSARTERLKTGKAHWTRANTSRGRTRICWKVTLRSVTTRLRRNVTELHRKRQVCYDWIRILNVEIWVWKWPGRWRGESSRGKTSRECGVSKQPEDRRQRANSWPKQPGHRAPCIQRWVLK